MRRIPNPWVLAPALLAGVLGGALGWIITAISCRPEGCVGWSIAAAIFGLVAGLLGITVVLSLTYRSIAEWRERDRR